MEQARIEQQRIMERERQKRVQQEEQRRYINEYKEMKRRTDSLLQGNGGIYQPGGNIYSGFDHHQNPAFYERHSNFGFPITTTTTNGAVITTMTGPGVNSSLNGPTTGKMDPLAQLNADVKSGNV